jgi:hypothetical protein
MFGEKIMVISALLKWYVEHDLKVTQIHQVALLPHSHISTICVHGAILEVRTIHKHVHEIVVKLQHELLSYAAKRITVLA